MEDRPTHRVEDLPLGVLVLVVDLVGVDWAAVTFPPAIHAVLEDATQGVALEDVLDQLVTALEDLEDLEVHLVDTPQDVVLEDVVDPHPDTVPVHQDVDLEDVVDPHLDTVLVHQDTAPVPQDVVLEDAVDLPQDTVQVHQDLVVDLEDVAQIL